MGCNGCYVEQLLRRWGNLIRENEPNGFVKVPANGRNRRFMGWFMSVEHCDDDDCKYVRRGQKPPNVREKITEVLGKPWYLRTDEEKGN